MITLTGYYVTINNLVKHLIEIGYLKKGFFRNYINKAVHNYNNNSVENEKMNNAANTETRIVLQNYC
jgi:hypothetical protein